MQHFAFAQQKGDEQAANTTIAVQERMDGFELRMSEPDLDQQRKLILPVQETLQIT